MNQRPRILLVGPLPIDGDVVGGTKVSFAHLVEQLTNGGRFELEVFNTSRAQSGRGLLGRTLNNLQQLGRLLSRLVQSPTPDLVFFNTSSSGALLCGPLVWALCRWRRRPLVLRVFGGDLDLFFERASAPLRWLASRTVLCADLTLLQTRALCEHFTSRAHVQWWPTTRDMRVKARPADRAQRFLFLGQLRREKGLCEALAAAKCLPPGATLSVYGPTMPGFDATETLAQSGCFHGGPLSPDQVGAVLAEHDVLVFPSYHAGEGMPGILIEAMQLGLPIIATNWRALAELVEHETNGLLVEARNTDQLAQAMTRLASDPKLHRQLAQGALRTGNRFRPADWIAWLEGELATLCGERAQSLSNYREVA